MAGLTLAIDQGTHSTRAIVFDSQGQAIHGAQQPVKLQRHSRTEIEQSPHEILQSMRTVIKEVLAGPGVEASLISAAGLATQRSSVLAWDRPSGEPLSPVLSWQDRRAADLLTPQQGRADVILQRTGLPLSPHYGASKLQWLLSNNTAVATALQDDTLAMGPLAAFLLHHLTDSPQEQVDDANASRTLLWNLQRRDWDDDLLAWFGLPATVLPRCRPVYSDYGHIENGAIPVTAVNGDQTAALYAHGTPATNQVSVNIGTGAFVLLPVADPAVRPDGLLAGIAYSDARGGGYYIEGTVNGAGAALAWAAKRFGLTNLDASLAGWLDGIGEPGLFINTVGGLGAPWWKDGPAAYFENPDITAPEAMVAVVESILFLIQENVTRLQAINPAIGSIRISGGLSRLDAICQKLANLSSLPVERPVQTEATARGIAWQAAGGPGDWLPEGKGTTFTPQTDPGLQARYQRFHDTISTL